MRVARVLCTVAWLTACGVSGPDLDPGSDTDIETVVPDPDVATPPAVSAPGGNPGTPVTAAPAAGPDATLPAETTVLDDTLPPEPTDPVAIPDPGFPDPGGGIAVDPNQEVAIDSLFEPSEPPTSDSP